MFFRQKLQGCLGMHCFGLNAEDNIIFEKNEEGSMLMPAASTVKVAIALSVMKKIYESGLDFSTPLLLVNDNFSPGPPWNTFDRNFFIPTNRTVNTCLGELLEAMLTESDNSATDKLIDWVGGVENVNQVILSLGITGFNLTRKCKQLLSDFYGFNSEKNIWNIVAVLDEFFNAYSIRAAETTWASRTEDTCTPEAMSHILKHVVINAHKTEDSWLCFAAKNIFEIMQRCKTGDNLIKAAAMSQPCLKYFGHKTGGLGSIRNDAAFIEFENGIKIILTIFSYASPQSLKFREQLIQDYAKEIIANVMEVTNAKTAKAVNC